ncbi:hypothetical protein GQ55_1G183800 [Panicum hallii var. hallii]|uniref:Uncharacterized protein n=1 Tax=Panicum hallii var. hallii TaxID=1504633 RepID=A0A2T7F653_9POAL|nr:hypothetical protein GQ55_1G183800 [Panicum hallii var. hallii]
MLQSAPATHVGLYQSCNRGWGERHAAAPSVFLQQHIIPGSLHVELFFHGCRLPHPLLLHLLYLQCC